MRGRSSPTLLRLLSFALPYWRTVALAWVCVAAASGFVLLMPQLIQLAIDRGLDINDEGLALGSKRTLVIIGLAIIFFVRVIVGFFTEELAGTINN